MSRVAVEPKLLKWARRRAGLEVRDLTPKFPQYEAWEQGEAKPTFKQLESFARKTATPFGYLFLDDPPEERLDIPDFRTVANEAVHGPSPDLLETIQLMERRQDWMREYLKDEGHEPLTFVGSAVSEREPARVAADIRATLGLVDGWASQAPNWESTRGVLRQAIEDIGILVVINGIVGNNTRRVLNPQEFRGFVLNDEYAPLIFVNGADAKAAQLFTMAHELAHVWMGQSGVFDMPRLLPGASETERFCHKVAAEFLVHAGLAEAESRGLSQSASGGDIRRIQTYRVGDRFARAVIGATKEGRLLYREAHALLGVKGATFESMGPLESTTSGAP